MFNVDAITWKTVAFIGVLTVLLPSAIAFAALLAVNSRQFLVAWVVCGFTACVAALIFAQLALARIVFDGSKLTVGGGLYSVSLNVEAIRIDDVKAINLKDGTFSLGARVNGIGLPGFALGWFQPSNGRKLFVLATDNQAILVPTLDKFDLVVSPTESERFLDALRNQ
jgi:hypothetical protein